MVMDTEIASNLNETAKLSHPSAKAPDHWRRKPNRAEIIIAQLFLKFQLNNNKPGGSNKGINVNKKNCNWCSLPH
jgi:hypothetical protein